MKSWTIIVVGPAVTGVLVTGCAAPPTPATDPPAASAVSTTATARPAATPQVRPTRDAAVDAQFRAAVGAGVPAQYDLFATADAICADVRVTPSSGGLWTLRMSQAGFTDPGGFLFQAIHTYCRDAEDRLLNGG